MLKWCRCRPQNCGQSKCLTRWTKACCIKPFSDGMIDAAIHRDLVYETEPPCQLWCVNFPLERHVEDICTQHRDCLSPEEEPLRRGFADQIDPPRLPLAGRLPPCSLACSVMSGKGNLLLYLLYIHQAIHEQSQTCWNGDFWF